MGASPPHPPHAHAHAHAHVNASNVRMHNFICWRSNHSPSCILVFWPSARTQARTHAHTQAMRCAGSRLVLCHADIRTQFACFYTHIFTCVCSYAKTHGYTGVYAQISSHVSTYVFCAYLCTYLCMCLWTCPCTRHMHVYTQACSHYHCSLVFRCCMRHRTLINKRPAIRYTRHHCMFVPGAATQYLSAYCSAGIGLLVWLIIGLVSLYSWNFGNGVAVSEPEIQGSQFALTSAFFR